MKYEADKILKLLNDKVNKGTVAYSLEYKKFEPKEFKIEHLKTERSEDLKPDNCYTVEGYCSYENVRDAMFECLIQVTIKNGNEELSLVGENPVIEIIKRYDVEFLYDGKEYCHYGYSPYVSDKNAELFAQSVINSYLGMCGQHIEGCAQNVFVVDHQEKKNINNIPMCIYLNNNIKQQEL